MRLGCLCHHSFNNDKRYYVTSSIEKDVDRLIEDLDKAFSKYRGAYHIGSKSKFLKPERERSRETGDWTLQIADEKELALYLDPWEERLLNFVMSHIYMEFSRWRNITFIDIKNRQSLSTRSVWFPLFCGGSWKTSSWFLLYIGSAQLFRRVKIDQLWICFSFWWNIFNNRLTAVPVSYTHLTLPTIYSV